MGMGGGGVWGGCVVGWGGLVGLMGPFWYQGVFSDCGFCFVEAVGLSGDGKASWRF